jgi:hypothetical protein
MLLRADQSPMPGTEGAKIVKFIFEHFEIGQSIFCEEHNEVNMILSSSVEYNFFGGSKRQRKKPVLLRQH